MISTVFIDVDDTLLDFALCSAQSIAGGLADAGLEYRDEYFPVFTRENDKLWRRVEDGSLTVEELYRIRWNIIFACLGIDLDGNDFEKSFLSHLRRSAIPVEGAGELLEYLHGKYTVCVASNAPSGQQLDRLTKAGMTPYIEHLFSSGDLGFSKPQREFFDACFAALPGVRPEDCIIIGDSLSSDMLGGINAGISTCWLDRRGQQIPPGMRIDHRVTRLSQIKSFL